MPHSPVIHVGQGLMLQPSLAAGLFSSLHPGLNWPLGSLQLTLRCLIPSPQETEHWNGAKTTFNNSFPLTIANCERGSWQLISNLDLLASSTSDLGTRFHDNMKTQLKWRHRNIPYVCTYFTPGFLAPGGTIFQHTVLDALRFFTSIALITCCAILISALYFTLPLSLAASHRTLHESSRTTIKLRILCFFSSSLSLLLHSVHDYGLRSLFFGAL